jgi:hypothetical protein
VKGLPANSRDEHGVIMAEGDSAQQRMVQMIFPEDLNRDQSIGELDSEHSSGALEWIN